MAEYPERVLQNAAATSSQPAILDSAQAASIGSLSIPQQVCVLLDCASTSACYPSAYMQTPVHKDKTYERTLQTMEDLL